MTYAVKEISYTLPGEGAQTGRPSVFCRFAGCNLWTGREEDRATAVCTFCDADFVGTDGTNGRRAVAPDWICVSPKADAPLVLTAGDELKLAMAYGMAHPRWRLSLQAHKLLGIR